MISIAIAVLVFILAFININIFHLPDQLLYGISIGLVVSVLVEKLFNR